MNKIRVSLTTASPLIGTRQGDNTDKHACAIICLNECEVCVRVCARAFAFNKLGTRLSSISTNKKIFLVH